MGAIAVGALLHPPANLSTFVDSSACVVALATHCATLVFQSDNSCSVCAGRQQAVLRHAGCSSVDIAEWCAQPQVRIETYDPHSGKLLRDFQSWSWGGVDVAAKHGGAYAICVPCASSSAFQMHGPLVLALGDLQSLELIASGSGSDISVSLLDGSGAAIGQAVSLRATIAGFDGLAERPESFYLPFSAFGSRSNDTRIHRLQVHCRTNPQAQQGGFLYLSGLSYTGFPRRPDIQPVSVVLSPAQKRRGVPPKISRDIYGVNFANEYAQLSAGYTVNRWGGNAAGTRYAWDIDTTNRAKDFYFESLPNRPLPSHPELLPVNSSADRFFNTSLGVSVTTSSRRPPELQYRESLLIAFRQRLCIVFIVISLVWHIVECGVHILQFRFSFRVLHYSFNWMGAKGSRCKMWIFC